MCVCPYEACMYCRTRGNMSLPQHMSHALNLNPGYVLQLVGVRVKNLAVLCHVQIEEYMYFIFLVSICT